MRTYTYIGASSPYSGRRESRKMHAFHAPYLHRRNIRARIMLLEMYNISVTSPSSNLFMI